MPALVRWEPFRDMRRVHDMLDRAFDEGLFGNAGEGLTLYEGLAPVDVYQTDEAIVVKASLPGVKPEDIDISVTGDTLTIRGEVTEEKSNGKPGLSQLLTLFLTPVLYLYLEQVQQWWHSRRTQEAQKMGTPAE